MIAWRLSGELDIGLVDESSRLQRVSNTLPAHVVSSERVELVVDEGEQGFVGTGLAVTHLGEQPRDVS